MSAATVVAAAVAFSFTDSVVARGTLALRLVRAESVSSPTSGTHSASRCGVYPTYAL